MAFNLSFYQTTSITAEAVDPLPGNNLAGKVGWVNLSINTLDGASFTLVAFFQGNPELAHAYADAINSVKVPVAATEEASQ